MSKPSSAPLLVLIGFMGAGKSTVGRILAEELSCPLIDLDAEITRIHGPISTLFASRGESGFRAIEHHQLNELLPAMKRPAVLALGGGAFLQPANRELLDQHSATVIYLDAPFEVLRERIAASADERPLATDPDRLRQLYELRRPTYLLAHHVIDASPNASTVVAQLRAIAHSIGMAQASEASRTADPAPLADSGQAK